jgi:hypothetical protein
MTQTGALVEGRLPAGSPSAVYSVDRRQLAITFLVSWALMPLGIALVVLSGLIDDWLLWFVVCLCIGVVGVACIFGGLVLFLRVLTAIGVRVRVYPSGLAWCRFGNVVYVPWGWIRSVRANRPRNLPVESGRPNFLFVLLFQYSKLLVCWWVGHEGGMELSLTSLRGLDQLGRAVEEEACRHLLPGALQAFQAGDTLDFGILAMSTKGITKGIHTQPWEEVTEIGVDADGWVAIGSKDRSWVDCIVVSPNKIQNRRLFLALLAEIKKLTGASWAVGHL